MRALWWVIIGLSVAVILASLWLIVFDGATNWFTPAGGAFTLLAAVVELVASRRRSRAPAEHEPPPVRATPCHRST
jgi:hypothetical protein